MKAEQDLHILTSSLADQVFIKPIIFIILYTILNYVCIQYQSWTHLIILLNKKYSFNNSKALINL